MHIPWQWPALIRRSFQGYRLRLAGQGKHQFTLTAIAGPLLLSKGLINVVLPGNRHLLIPDNAKLITQPIDESLNRVFYERDQIPSRFAGRIKLLIIAAASLVIVIAQEVACRLRNSRSHKDGEFHKPCRSAVSIAERVNPREITVGNDGFENGIDDGVFRSVCFLGRLEFLSIEPFAQPIEKHGAFFGGSATIGISYDDGICSDFLPEKFHSQAASQQALFC